MSLDFSPSLAEKRMSPKERAGITVTTVFGFIVARKALKYCLCAKEDTEASLRKLPLATASVPLDF